MSDNQEVVKQNCIFCKIVNGEVDSYKVYEDDKCICILDINPVADGHVLLVPKEHYMILPVVPNELLNHLSVIVKNQVASLKEILGCKEVKVFIANGPAAGQQSNHFMIHLIPEYEGQESVKIGLKEIEDKSKLEEIYKQLKMNLTQNTTE